MNRVTVSMAWIVLGLVCLLGGAGVYAAARLCGKPNVLMLVVDDMNTYDGLIELSVMTVGINNIEMEQYICDFAR